MNRYNLFFFLLIFSAAFSVDFALPRFALMTNSQCIDCHVNPTGGNLRNNPGWTYGKNKLALVSPRDDDFKMTNRLGENILFGLDFRTQYLVKMTDSTKQTDFQRMTGSIYTGVELSEDINLSARYDFIWSIWEAYATAHILPNNSYVKVGSFTPNFGIRSDDHTAYTRGGDLGVLFQTGRYQGLIYEPRYVETGAEVGFYISDLALLTASVGNNLARFNQQFVTDPAYTASLQIMPQVSDDIGLFLGGSFADFKKDNITFSGKDNVMMYGGFAGIGTNCFSLMGEFYLANDFYALDSTSSAMMVEGSYRIIQGLDAVIRYDRFDLSIDSEKNDVSRLTIGFEFIPYSFIEVRPQYRLQMEDPKIDNDSFVLQFHLWY
jgi:hypothetical protein